VCLFLLCQIFILCYFIYICFSFSLENRRNVIVPTPISIASPSEFFNSTIANAQFFIMSSVQPNTRGTYCSGWKHWNAWAEKFETNATLSVVPSYYVADSSMSFHVTCILSFMTYLSLYLHLTPRTCNNYVSAVRYFLINANVDVSFLDNNPVIRATRTEMANHHVSTHLVAKDHTLNSVTWILRFDIYVKTGLNNTNNYAILQHILYVFSSLHFYFLLFK